MALTNILKQTDQVLLADGSPAGGGSVFLYEPGTTTPITSYQDSGLVVPHSNPVKLSGAGRANIWINRNADLLIQDRNGATILTSDSINPDTLDASESGGLVPNGSFEVDSDSNNVPDGYTLSSSAGASNSLDNTQSTSGSWSMRFTSTGSGGGNIVTTDFFPVNDVDQLRVNVDMFSTVAGVRNIVRVEWYDVSQVSISNTDAYDSTSNPTSWTTQNLFATPPSGARFAKLRLIGIDASVALAGITYFDNLSVFYPAVVSGVFDNITIQNNQIITTNLNGSLELGPNGTGQVNVNNNTNVTLANLGAFNIGTDDPSANGHMAISRSTIQAKTNGTTAGNMSINPFGGIVTLGEATSEVRVAPPLYLGRGSVVDLVDVDNALNIGTYTASSSPHLAMDATQLQAKADATTAAQLELNNLGGNVRIGASSASEYTLFRHTVRIGAAALVDLTDTENALNIGAGDPSTTAHMAFDQNDIQAKADATTVADLNIQRLGGNLDLGAQSGTGTVTIFHNGGARLITDGSSQLIIRGDVAGTVAASTAISTELKFQSSDGNDFFLVGYANAASDDVKIRNRSYGGRIDIQATNAAGVQQNLFQGDPDGAATIYHDGSARITTSTQGITVSAPSSGNSEFFFYAPFGADGRIALLGSSGGAQLKVDSSGTAAIRQTDASGNDEDVWLDLNRNGAVALRHNATSTARTATTTNGGFEVNNQETGAGFERVLTESDLGPEVLISVLGSDSAITTDTTPNTIFQLTSVPVGKYHAEIFILWNQASTTPGLRYQISVSSTGDSDFLMQRSLSLPGVNGTGDTIALPANTQDTVSGSGPATTLDQILVGTGLVDLTGGTQTVGFSAAQDVSSADATTIKAGSYIKLTRLDG
jgi:hypothetical protein